MKIIIIFITILFGFNDEYNTRNDGIIHTQTKKPIKVIEYRYKQKFGDYEQTFYRETVNKYDSQNNLIYLFENNTDHDNNSSTFKYNNGLIEEEKKFDENGELVNGLGFSPSVFKYKYDSKNRLITEAGYDQLGEDIGIGNRYKYDSNNNLIEKKKYYRKRLKRIFHYKYDFKNRLIAEDGYEVEKNGEKFPDDLIEFEYDENNNLIKVNLTKRERSIRKSFYYYYYNNDNKLIRLEFENREGAIEWEIDFKYNLEDGLLIEEIFHYYGEDNYGEKIKYPEYKLVYLYD